MRKIVDLHSHSLASNGGCSSIEVFVALFLVVLSWPLITLITGIVKKIGDKRN